MSAGAPPVLQWCSSVVGAESGAHDNLCQIVPFCVIGQDEVERPSRTILRVQQDQCLARTFVLRPGSPRVLERRLLQSAQQIGVNVIDITNRGSIIAETSAGLTFAARNDFVNEGLLHVTGEGFMSILTAPFTTSGQVIIDETRELDRTGDYTQTAGETNVNGTLDVSTFVDLQGGRLTGTGVIEGDVDNVAGTVSPGNSIGTMTVDGDYTQDVLGTLLVQTDGVGNDLLSITGTAMLGGELRIVSFDCETFDNGLQFTVLTAATVEGQFDEITGPGVYDVSYTADSVVVTVVVAPVIGDIDEDGVVGTTDLMFLLEAWGPCDDGADCPADLDSALGRTVGVPRGPIESGTWGCPPAWGRSVPGTLGFPARRNRSRARTRVHVTKVESDLHHCSTGGAPAETRCGPGPSVVKGEECATDFGTSAHAVQVVNSR